MKYNIKIVSTISLQIKISLVYIVIYLIKFKIIVLALFTVGGLYYTVSSPYKDYCMLETSHN